eukprot:m.284344 g.284344  ORF g.284344 m.284344 type:complete len:138 (+) comp19906_c0_seq3:2006-2419(+)
MGENVQEEIRVGVQAAAGGAASSEQCTCHRHEHHCHNATAHWATPAQVRSTACMVGSEPEWCNVAQKRSALDVAHGLLGTCNSVSQSEHNGIRIVVMRSHRKCILSCAAHSKSTFRFRTMYDLYGKNTQISVGILFL